MDRNRRGPDACAVARDAAAGDRWTRFYPLGNTEAPMPALLFVYGLCVVGVIWIGCVIWVNGWNSGRRSMMTDTTKRIEDEDTRIEGSIW